MSASDVLTEIRKLDLDEARKVAERLADYLREREREANATEDTEAREDEFERHLLAKGVISHIPTRDETDEEFASSSRLKLQANHSRKPSFASAADAG